MRHRLPVPLPLILASLLLASPLFALGSVDWRGKLSRDAVWLAGAEARAVADTILAYQYPCGGWPKNKDMGVPLTDAQKAELAARDEASGKGDGPTIDNGATHGQIRFLAQLFAVQPDARFSSAALRGLDYLFTAQYANGGWPQIFPLRKGYYSHVTFNDDAMANTMELLRDVAGAKAPFAFVDEARRGRAADAIKRGLDCILRCQIVVDGQPTAWAAQHDEKTLAPAAARKFEPVCFASHESAGIVRYLMSLDAPSPEILAAVTGAVAWFGKTKITGIRCDLIQTPEGKDRVVVVDPAAEPIWARFYELGSLRPIFSGRDSVIHYTMAELDRERRGGYAWYGDRPGDILKKVPAWSAKWSKTAATAPAAPALP